MKCELRIISGARAGHREVFDKSYIGIGRHPLSDVRFDAEQDLDASTRHAAIVKTGATFVLRDLGSTNGTFVNGEKLAGERQLHDGNTLRFGVHGPEVSFHLVREGEEVIMEAVHAPSPKTQPTRPEGIPVHKESKPGLADKLGTKTPAAPMKPPDIGRPRAPSQTSILRAEISSQRSRYQALAVTLVIIILGAIGIVVWQGRSSNAAVTNAQNTADSLRRENAALRRLQVVTDSEKTALQSALLSERDPARKRAMQSRLTQLTARSDAIRTAQGVDYTRIREQNDRAIAKIFIRFPDSSLFTGTAFSVTTTGQMITNKHVVLGEHGARPLEIAIQFSGSSDVLPARLVRVSDNADLALLQLESQGPFPMVAGLATQALEVGAPIAMMGFPGAVTGAAQQATMVTGSVTRVVPDSLYELDSFSGSGASGSPIFDRDGKVIGVEYGGLVGTGGRAIVGLPIARAQALLAR